MTGEETSFGDLEFKPTEPIIEFPTGRKVINPRLAEAMVQLAVERGGFGSDDGGKGKGGELAELRLPLNPSGQSGAALAIPRLVELDLIA